MTTPAISVLEHLVLKKLAGNSRLLLALLSYITVRDSPSTVCRKYRVDRMSFTMLLTRLRMKALSDQKVVEYVAKKYIPTIINEVPTVINKRGGTRCMVCGKKINIYPESHLRNKHSDLIRNETIRVIKTVKLLSEIS